MKHLVMDRPPHLFLLIYVSDIAFNVQELIRADYSADLSNCQVPERKCSEMKSDMPVVGFLAYLQV
jgi:hypothetical protein